MQLFNYELYNYVPELYMCMTHCYTSLSNC